MTERQRAYQINRRDDLLAESLEIDGPDRVHLEGWLLEAAEAALDAEALGLVQPYQFLVVAYPDGTGWGYRALEPDEQVRDGCLHTVHSATMALARSEAVTEHLHEHLGR